LVRHQLIIFGIAENSEKYLPPHDENLKETLGANYTSFIYLTISVACAVGPSVTTSSTDFFPFKT